MADQKAVVVGISGCSSSGKTTLARILRDIFPETFILHEDDFYKTDEEIPLKNGIQDWDCLEALSVPDMEKSLEHIRSHGTFPVSSSNCRLVHRSEHGCSCKSRNTTTTTSLGPHYPSASPAPSETPFLTTSLPPQPQLESKEDQNSIGKCPVSDARIAAAKARVQAWLQPGQPGHDIFAASSNGERKTKICLLDGFLLYSQDMARVMDLLDIKLFLLVSHAKATQRREARDGYVTLEGFWKDPPGYVDKIVWPNYAAAHAWLFKEGDVEGELDEGLLKERRIKAQVGKGLDINMETTLDWAVETIMRELESLR